MPTAKRSTTKSSSLSSQHGPTNIIDKNDAVSHIEAVGHFFLECMAMHNSIAHVVFKTATGVFLVATLLIAGRLYAGTDDWFMGIRLEKVDGLRGKDTLNAGDTIQFHLSYKNHSQCALAVSNAFRVFSRASLTSGAVGSGTASWVTTPPVNRPFGTNLTSPSQSFGIQVDTTGFFKKKDFGGLFIFRCFSCDGSGSDTIIFAGAANDANQRSFGIGDSGVPFVFWMVTRPEDTGKVICIDSSSNYPPSGTWKWVGFNGPYCGWAFPEWSGLRCFTLAPYKCCVGSSGNIDCDAADRVDIADISTLIDHLYLSNRPLCCLEQADCDGVGAVDIADLSALINYLYISFLPLAPCP